MFFLGKKWCCWRKPCHKKSIAVCISGCIRSFPRASYREGLKRLLSAFPKAHFFLLLKCNDVKDTKHPPLFLNKAGVDGFINTMDIIRHNTKSITLFDEFADEEVNNSRFASQLRMMDICFNTASKHRNYDFYIRYRPDFVLLDTQLPNDPDSIDKNTIYTTRKLDAIASDQVFMFSKKLKKEWWDKCVIPTAKAMLPSQKISPEYFIFDEKKDQSSTIQNGPLFYGGLLRTNENHLMFWDEHEKEYSVIDDWKPMTLDTKPEDTIQLLTNALREQGFDVHYQRYIT
jgi:hypothetical protein